MTDVTVKQFAEVVGVPSDRLLAQLVEAGMEIDDVNATISETQKSQLLDFLRESHGKRGAPATGSAPKKITLKRKMHSELHTTVPVARGPAGRAATRGPRTESKTVTVEVRKKRTYVKRADLLAEEQERLEQEAAEKARVEAEEQAGTLVKDLADLRLSEVANQMGLLSEQQWRSFGEKREAIEREAAPAPSRRIGRGWLKPVAGAAIAASVALVAVMAVEPGPGPTLPGPTTGVAAAENNRLLDERLATLDEIDAQLVSIAGRLTTIDRSLTGIDPRLAATDER